MKFVTSGVAPAGADSSSVRLPLELRVSMDALRLVNHAPEFFLVEDTHQPSSLGNDVSNFLGAEIPCPGMENPPAARLGDLVGIGLGFGVGDSEDHDFRRV